MRLIDRKDIERWAQQFDAKGNFPVLIARLVYAIAPKEAFVNFPSGSAVFVGGYDGVVNSPSGDSYVPEGVSLWEFGTEGAPKGKAERDYNKRSADPLGYACADSTFIFVTPFFWREKDKWRLSKLREGKWKDIRVYDSSFLEQWLDQAAAASRWFSTYLGTYPADGIVTIEEYWREFTLGPMGKLPAIAISAGRELEIQALKDFLTGDPGIRTIKAASREEATAFILAAAQQFQDAEKDRFNARTLIIDTAANFRSVRINVKNLNLIAKFDDTQGLYLAAADGHHVLVPQGPDDSLNQETIELPIIDRDGQINGLIEMGLSDIDAERFSREAGRDITILKRLLRFPQNKLPWLNETYIRQLVPAMLIGRWHARKAGDQHLLERLANQSYEQYLQVVNQLTVIAEAPLLKIGDLYRLLSPLDTWATLASHITSTDLDLLASCFHQAFALGNPLVLPVNEEERWIIEFNKEKTYSAWVREGLAQSLILVAIYGDKLKLVGISQGQLWVDRQINNLLEDATGELWVSLDRELPLLAEAAPESFLNAIAKSLNDPEPSLMQMFVEEDGFLTKNSHHAGLLWALEGLAWLPEYLPEAAMLLAKLATLDPGGQLANRPINSLFSIFTSWFHQTLASLEERKSVIRQICDVEPEIGWKLLIHLLPNHHAIAHPTHRIRWRVFGQNFNISHTHGDRWDIVRFAVKLLPDMFDDTDSSLKELLHHSVDLALTEREIVFQLARSKASTLKDNQLKSWGEIRRILSQHRSFPETDWALPSAELKPYQELYELLTPADSLAQLRWLFDNWPDFPEGGDADERKDQQISRRRIEATKRIIDNFGLSSVISFSNQIEEPWSLGVALAQIPIDQQQSEKLLASVDFEQPKQVKFIRGFLGYNSESRNMQWVRQNYAFLEAQSISDTVKVLFLTALTPNGELWDMIDNLSADIRNQYWQQMHPWFYASSRDEKLRGLRTLINYKRFFTAIYQLDFMVDDLPSELLTELLEKAAMEEASETGHFDHHVEHLLDKMEDRTDIPQDQKIKLEWLYMPILGSFNAKRRPENLHVELTKSPAFFVEVLTWLYRPKHSRELAVDTENYTQEMIINRAESSRKLLNSWRTVPGSRTDGTVDEEALNLWVDKARELAAKEDRSEVADAQIGLLLARYPERETDWPPLPISQLIERLDNEVINRNFRAQVFNNHGSSSRGPFDGGNIERKLADRFNRFADQHKLKHRKLSRIFRDLANGYLIQAKHMDEEAKRDRLEY